MDGLRPPGAVSFEGDNVADIWGKCCQPFEWYMYAIKAVNEADMRKISLFLTVAGPEAQEVYGTFTYGTDDSLKTM